MRWVSDGHAVPSSGGDGWPAGRESRLSGLLREIRDMETSQEALRAVFRGLNGL
jgi:hypothetical protein